MTNKERAIWLTLAPASLGLGCGIAFGWPGVLIAFGLFALFHLQGDKTHSVAKMVREVNRRLNEGDYRL